MINKTTQDVRICGIESLRTPAELAAAYPITDGIAARIRGFRNEVNAIVKGEDRRLLAVIGPCSIHDPQAALDYARRLKGLSDRVSDVFRIVMRTYFEKPRTALGWRGLIVDPDMDSSYNIEKGLTIARKLLIDVPQYTDELMSWSSIGARTTESQTHRALASGLSVAVGFKNSTSGDLTAAVNACKSASSPASFIGVERDGRLAVYHSAGNDSYHIILRGGDDGPNYYEDDVEDAKRMMASLGLEPRIVIDCSHQNSRKDFRRQKRVLRSIVDQIRWGEEAIRGFMLESNIEEGSQKIGDDLSALKYGVSVTDACIGWEETERIVLHAADIVREAYSNGGHEEVL